MFRVSSESETKSKSGQATRKEIESLRKKSLPHSKAELSHSKLMITIFSTPSQED